MKAPKSSVEGTKNEPVELNIIYDVDSKSRWIFDAKIVDTKSHGSNYQVLSKIDPEASKKVETLTIKKMDTQYEGIYTVEVTKDSCTSAEIIFVSAKEKAA